MTLAEDILKHHGIKGMKWGVRRDGSGGSSKGSSKTPAHDDSAHVQSIKNLAKASGTHALSNAELKKAIERMNMEQQFSRLNGGHSSPSKTATKFIKDTLKNIGKQQVAALGNQIAAKQVAKLLGG